MAIQRDPTGELTSKIGSQVKTVSVINDAFKDSFGKTLFTDEYSLSTSANAQTVPMALMNALLAYIGSNVNDVNKYGILPYSKKLADNYLYGEQALILGSDGVIYQVLPTVNTTTDVLQDPASNDTQYTKLVTGSSPVSGNQIDTIGFHIDGLIKDGVSPKTFDFTTWELSLGFGVFFFDANNVINHPYIPKAFGTGLMFILTSTNNISILINGEHGVGSIRYVPPSGVVPTGVKFTDFLATIPPPDKYLNNVREFEPLVTLESCYSYRRWFCGGNPVESFVFNNRSSLDIILDHTFRYNSKTFKSSEVNLNLPKGATRQALTGSATSIISQASQKTDNLADLRFEKKLLVDGAKQYWIEYFGNQFPKIWEMNIDSPNWYNPTV